MRCKIKLLTEKEEWLEFDWEEIPESENPATLVANYTAAWNRDTILVFSGGLLAIPAREIVRFCVELEEPK